tara:strand:+ start:909 stop:1373 length:465 start_codon:yes stop_codon:yes gene_type:complete
MKKFLNLFILLMFVSSCGFKNINLEGENDLNISQIILVGNKKIGRVLHNEILLISSSKGSDKIEINLSTDKLRKVSNKDNSGKITKYDIIITADLIITNLNSQKIIRKSFVKSGSFDVKTKHIDTINTEKKETRNLTNQVAEEILNYFKISYKN